MALPTVSSDCIEKPAIFSEAGCGVNGESGELTYIYLTKTPVVDWTAPNFTDLIDNDQDTVLDDTVIVKIPVTGSIPEPTRATQLVEGGQTLSADPVFTLTANTYNFTQENYDAMRTITYRNKSFYMYYAVGKYIYGGYADSTDGILTNVSINPIMDGADTFAYFKIDASWKAPLQPDRALNIDV